MASIKPPPAIAQDPLALAMWARGLYFKDRVDEAVEAGLAAVESAPGDREVRDLVGSAFSANVAPYHVQMLNDGRRNRAYVQGIESAVRPGMRVLEIGTGAGLLALIAARAGAQVHTCERNPATAATARIVAERNGFGDRIHVIAKLSTDVIVGEDIPERADLLLSEVFGQRLFNEGVIDSIADARSRLVKPGAPVVPPRAEIRCALVDTITKADRADIGMVEGFDLSAANLLAPPSVNWLECKAATAQRRSPPQSALARDFGSEPPFGDDSDTIELVSEGGQVNGVAQWLRIDFGDGIVHENDPFRHAQSSWGRPIALLPRPIATKPGDVVRVRLRRIGRELMISLERTAT